MKNIMLSLALIISMDVGAGTFYRWIDPSGVVHYSDTPYPGAEKIDSIKSSGDVSPDDNLPYETRQAQQNFPVTLYTADGCGETCDQARSLLNKRGVPYSEKVLRTKQDVAGFKLLSGINGVVPVLAVGKSFLKGFLDTQWNNELDIAGYPKTAGYRQRIAPPPSPPAGEPPSAQDQPAQNSFPEVQDVPSEPAAQ